MPNALHPQQHGPSQDLGIHLICYPNYNMLVYQLNPKLLETAIDHTEFMRHLAAVNFNIRLAYNRSIQSCSRDGAKYLMGSEYLQNALSEQYLVQWVVRAQQDTLFLF